MKHFTPNAIAVFKNIYSNYKIFSGDVTPSFPTNEIMLSGIQSYLQQIFDKAEIPTSAHIEFYLDIGHLMGHVMLYPSQIGEDSLLKPDDVRD
eukprot:CAMPEP_0170553662 /NCGR_PEP_ID=MMETSP0211-20121228/11504_1 /TAXON_ID=311385 /ORGANISM="Pseudokeronopsis sp., Strain OXSARD2" /LENGTH=92 /DNA_ID=CAMNT_0010862147 /DNA_START=234 /DNA_END=509 /DNA_ORIENTATION=+